MFVIRIVSDDIRARVRQMTDVFHVLRHEKRGNPMLPTVFMHIDVIKCVVSRHRES